MRSGRHRVLMVTAVTISSLQTVALVMYVRLDWRYIKIITNSNKYFAVKMAAFGRHTSSVTVVLSNQRLHVSNKQLLALKTKMGQFVMRYLYSIPHVGCPHFIFIILCITTRRWNCNSSHTSIVFMCLQIILPQRSDYPVKVAPFAHSLVWMYFTYIT